MVEDRCHYCNASLSSTAQRCPACKRPRQAHVRLRTADLIGFAEAPRPNSQPAPSRPGRRRRWYYAAGAILAAALVTLLLFEVSGSEPETNEAQQGPLPTSAPTPRQSPSAASVVAQPSATVGAQTPTLTAADSNRLVIGLAVEPDTLYGLVSTISAQKLVEYTFKEPWITQLNYTLRANPRYLQGDLPTLENGGAVMEERESGRQLVLTWKLQPGLMWSDGAALTAEDVVWSHEVGCHANSGAISFAVCEGIERVELVDALTWRVFFKPDYHNPAYFTIYNGQNLVLPKHQLASLAPEELLSDPRVMEHPLGWGPYKTVVDGWDRGASLRLVKNEHYVGGPQLPAIEEIRFEFAAVGGDRWRALTTGAVHLIDSLTVDTLPQLREAEQAGTLRVYYLPTTIWEHIDFNLNRRDNLALPSLLADPTLRRAIAHGTNRQLYVDTLFGGGSRPVHSWILRLSWAYAGDANLTLYQYDPQYANLLLDQAGYLRGADGIRSKGGQRLSFSYQFVSGGVTREQLAQLFQADMREIGIEIRLEQVPSSVLFGDESGLARRDFELANYAWVRAAEPGGWRLYACDQIPSPQNHWSGQNYTGWCNPTADEALMRATSSLMLEERRQAYLVHQQEFTRDVPSLPLFNWPQLFASVAELRGLYPSPTEHVTWNIAEWTLAEQ